MIPVFVAGAVSSGLVLAVFLTNPPAAADHAPLALAAGVPAARLIAAEPAAMELSPRVPVRVRQSPTPTRAGVRAARQAGPAPPAALPATRGSASTLSERVARFVVGDGRHTVRPFPMLPDER